MFADIKTIENEIVQFKSNMNSVDGLLVAVKEVCGKMDTQIRQSENYVNKLADIQSEVKDEMDKLLIAAEKTREEINISNDKSFSQIRTDFDKTTQLLNESSSATKQLFLNQIENLNDVNQLIENITTFQKENSLLVNENFSKLFACIRRIENKFTTLEIIATIGFLLVLAFILIF